MWIGTNDGNMVIVSETEFGGGAGCSTCHGAYDKPRVAVQYVDSTTMRVTEFGYDWRGRQTHVHQEEDAEGNATYLVQTYDNRDRVVMSEKYLLASGTGGSGYPGGSGSGWVPDDDDDPAEDVLLARTEYFYDTRGRVWKTEQSVVDPADGTVHVTLISRSWFNAKGRSIKQIKAGTNMFVKQIYDSLGRVTKTYHGLENAESGYAAASDVTGDTVLTQSETIFDNLGNAILSTQIERLSTASGTGELSLATGRYQSTANWFDGMGRQIATANYGTNGGVALTRPAIVPTRSDDCLVTEMKYDISIGRMFLSIDPAGKEHRTFFDAAGRKVKTVANYVGTGEISPSHPDRNVTVEYAYHSSGQIETLTAKNSVTGDQVTRYVYGTAKAWTAPVVYRNDLLVAEIYPDSDDVENSSGILENGLDNVADRVEFQYNRAGERIWKKDQNGSIHRYEYDNLGRLIHDRVTTLGNGVDDAVRRISTAHTVTGQVKSITSHANATVGTGAIVNQVMYEYDENDMLSREYTSHDGAVDVWVTPFIGCEYDSIENDLRLTTQIYPSGKRVGYEYDAFGRVVTLLDGENDLVEYEYSGGGAALRTKYVEPNLTLDYTTSGALDCFDRITDHAWKNGSGNDVVRIKHAYDRSGNRLNRQDMVNPTWSETYDYDEMDQLIALQRSDLAEMWQYDATGNWMQYDRNNVVENRSHNKANEILTGVVHDRNGNMTVMPGLKGKYDAWNRLVEVRDVSDNLIAEYSYNGLNHRISKKVGNVATNSFFNEKWQELESTTDNDTTTYVWGLRYIDDLICREKGNERLYSLADPNWNVVVLADTSGDVSERMKYDAFGKITWLDEDFDTKNDSGFAWDRAFTGQVLDAETGLMLYRNRYYHTELGRFASRDPIGYESMSNNLYFYVANKSLIALDSFGLNETLNQSIANMQCQIVVGLAREGKLDIATNSLGFTVCFCKQLLTCINWPTIYQHFNSDGGRRIIGKCVSQHEGVHAVYYSDCSNKADDYIGGARRDDISKHHSECYAHMREYLCLHDSLHECGHSVSCKEDVEKRMKQAYLFMRHHCIEYGKEIEKRKR